MLSYLRVAAFATIEELSVSFDQGLTVITGETGAGKSLLVDALSFVAGEKPRGLSIRPGCGEGVVEALFTPPSGVLPEGLSELVSPDDDIVVRRVLGQNGRVRQTVNGQNVSLSQLQSLAAILVDLVGQGENVRIVRPEAHRQILDIYAGTTELADSFETLRRALAAKRREREEERLRQESLFRDREWQAGLRQDAAHLEARPGEYEELSGTLTAQLHVQDLARMSGDFLNSLREEDQSVLSTLGRLAATLDRMIQVDGTLRPMQGSLTEASEILKDLAQELRSYQESLEMDPEALSRLEARFALYRRLAQKYQVRPEELANYFLASLTEEKGGDGEELARIDREIRAMEETLLEIGRSLTGLRTGAIEPLVSGILARLRKLRIGTPDFSVALVPFGQDVPGPLGMERVEFLFSANPGMPKKPLGEVASGGELSRVLLAIKALLSDRDTVPTLVFDEIDSGIGGEVGEVLGDLLREIGASRQVIAITHLHQVARKGSDHLLVHKTADGSGTRSGLSRIAGEDRVREIARMLGGEHLSPSTLTIARELLES